MAGNALQKIMEILAFRRRQQDMNAMNGNNGMSSPRAPMPGRGQETMWRNPDIANGGGMMPGYSQGYQTGVPGGGTGMPGGMPEDMGQITIMAPEQAMEDLTLEELAEILENRQKYAERMIRAQRL